MLHSNSWNALRAWTRKCLEDIRFQQVRLEISGCFNPGYANPRNGLFYMTREMVEFGERRWDEDISLQVYCFTNFGQGPELEIFYMPVPCLPIFTYRLSKRV